jgi:hypothetical protein
VDESVLVGPDSRLGRFVHVAPAIKAPERVAGEEDELPSMVEENELSGMFDDSEPADPADSD